MSAESPTLFLKRLQAYDAQLATSLAAGGAFTQVTKPAERSQSVAEVIGFMIKVRPCIDCGTEFEGIIGLCPDCSEARIELEKQKQEADRDRTRQAYWRSICPVTYRDTDWSNRRLSRSCVIVAQGWKPGQKLAGIEDFNTSTLGGISLGLFGTTGCGKTRAAFHILQRHYQNGWSVYAVHSADAWDNGEHVQGLSSAVRLQYSENSRIAEAARACLTKAREAQMLLIDDIGKERTTSEGTVSEAVGEALYSLIEYRVSHSRPILWTCNMSAGGLEKRLGEDRGGPVLRRLRDVSAMPRL